MTTSRSESQPPQYGRKRSNTVQSVYKPPPVVVPAIPLKNGDSKVLTTWVHDTKDSPSVILNQMWWPGVAEGDMIELSVQPPEQGPSSSVLFRVQKDEATKHQLQVSVPRPMADRLGLRNNGDVLLTKVEKGKWDADFVELTFQDQYLGRNEMWRMNQHLVGQCVYVNQEISFIGVVSAKVHAIYIAGKQVSTASINSRTKLVYRSLSARATIFIQVCRELWEFAGDGERYNEKIVHSFLPALFTRWREAGTTHIVTIVLISRVYYDESEIGYAAGPLRRDDDNRWYKDFFKVITDLEVVYDWRPTLVNLKESFWDFQRDILLAHHYHRATVIPDPSPPHSKQDSGSVSDPENVRLVGQLSYAHDGPILEALNLSLNPMETHYIDRSLSLTGSTTIIITPGTGYFRVNKQLLRLTTTRLLDQGFALDLVSLTKPPLHQSPIFAFRGYEPEVTGTFGSGSRTLDALWAAEDQSNTEKSDRKLVTFWWEPFWLSVSFWDRQMDLPFREDRFVARAKMQEIEMLGLLDHDVLSSIELPYLPDLVDPSATPNPRSLHASISSAGSLNVVTKVEADKFDMEIFSNEKLNVQHTARNSVVSLSNSAGSSFRTSGEGLRRPLSMSNRFSDPSRISTIEESPFRITTDLPSISTEPPAVDEQHAEKTLPILSPSISGNSNLLSTSPSQSSIMSSRTARSTSSVLSTASSTTKVGSRNSSASRPSTAKGTSMSRFAPSWLWSPFSRSGISEPETSAVSASGVTSPLTSSPLTAQPVASTSRLHAHAQLQSKQQLQPPTQPHGAIQRSPKPMKIQSSTIGRSGLARTLEEDSMIPHRGSLTRQTPLNTPPRDEAPFVKRRGTLSSIMPALGSSSSPITRTNPSRPLSVVPPTQSALARRWEHMFPRPLSKHDIKWKSMITPGCLPLTVEFIPSGYELESNYIVSPYDFVVDPPEMRSWLFRPPVLHTGHVETIRRAWALAVMRTMIALRLAQGFQIVLASSTPAVTAPFDSAGTLRRSASYATATDDDMAPKFKGAAEVLHSVSEPVYLSMSNEIHRIGYSGDSIQVRRYVRRMPRTAPYEYQCLIWPKLGVGYTELRTSFVPHGLENYSWNRLDMLAAGYENQFSESLRYWRTRFVVIPADEIPLAGVGPPGEKLSDEEVRLLGMDKLAELFTKARWVPSDERHRPTAPPVRFLPTDLGPTQCVLDEVLLAQLDEIHAAGPLRKKMRSEKDLADTPLAAIAKAMREEDGVPMKDRRWHGRLYINAFTGADFVSWLIREFRDVPTREQATEWGTRLHEQGLFDHCRWAHGFLDGHYFYVMRGEYLVPMTPRGGWFRSARHTPGDESSSSRSTSTSARPSPAKKARKKLILSQSMVIDIDPQKKSDQAEHVVLHHDIIHNPLTCFHFELHWAGTTARCIDDAVRAWGRAIERYGLRLVEAYVQPIADVRERNAFQSCFPVPLALPPPHVPHLAARVPEGIPGGERHYFECALLRRMGFVLDCEPPEAYPDAVDVVYSYRRAPFRHAQYVHRDGVAFVQVIGGTDGFLFLTNRLIAPTRAGLGPGVGRKPHAAAEELRISMQKFCENVEALRAFYDEEIALLRRDVEEDPPELNI